MKVANGLIHGDSRSHVILSPGCLSATANHTCEVILTMLNVAYEEHGDLPMRGALQFDGASVNRNILIMAFLGLYVMEGVFLQFRARNEVEEHAHDLYDAFHAITNNRVRASTFFYYEELVNLIKAAHKGRGAQPKRPIMGPDVKVSSLWSIRDFWEWLAPGYVTGTHAGHQDQAVRNGAFQSFSKFAHYRDFLVQLEDGSTPENPRVGLWAKAYITTKDYEYLGTLISKDSFDAVTQSQPPPVQVRDVAAAKKNER